MNADARRPGGVPAWVPRNAQLYLRHTEEGLSLREIARSEGCHPSTILRKVRAYENRRDDPLVDEALTRIGSVLRPQAGGPQMHGPGPAPSDSETQTMTACPPAPRIAAVRLPDEATLRGEARRVLRRLTEGEAVLAVSAELDKAVVLKGDMRTAVVDRQVAEAFAVKDWISVVRPGRVTTYGITTAGRAALRRMLTDDQATGLAEAPMAFADQHRIWGARVDLDAGEPARKLRINLAESPIQMLARRREKDGSVFLTPDLVAAAERLREDFELSQIGPRVAQNWDRFLTGVDRGQFQDGGAPNGALRARDRVGAALRDLGPGLGDVVLRCCCYLEGLEIAERRMGWSARSGKIVLRIALIRLKRHYDEVYGGQLPLIG